MTRALVLIAAVAVASSAACRRGDGEMSERMKKRIEARKKRKALTQPLDGPKREPGPPRAESPAELTATRARAKRVVDELIHRGMAPAKIAGIADSRGYALYRQRYFRQARAWFEQGMRADPNDAFCTYNAARVASLSGDLKRARAHLSRLHELNTPLARSRIKLAVEDPDLSALRAR